MGQTARRIVRLGAALLLAGTALAAEAERPAVDRPAPEPLETLLVRIQRNISNASAKLRSDVAGVGAGEGTSHTRLCCGANLDRLERQFAELERLSTAFERCYAAIGDAGQGATTALLRQDVVALERAVARFGAATSKPEALGTLRAVTRAYLLLRETAARLEPCAGVAESPRP